MISKERGILKRWEKIIERDDRILNPLLCMGVAVFDFQVQLGNYKIVGISHTWQL